jgi:hypothetical protein
MMAIYHNPITMDSFSTDNRPTMIDKMIKKRLKIP